jgi:carboxylesterase
MEALVTIPGAEPWSAPGSGERGRTGVVLVHGFTASPLALRPMGQRLAAEGYAVEIPLLPGHGTSHRDLARTRYADWFGAVQRATEQLAASCSAVVLVGHSMGGTLSLDLASRRPDQVSGCVVINPLVSDPHQPLAKLAPVLQYLLPFLPRDLAGLPTDDIARPGASEAAYGIISARAAQSLTRELPRVRSQLPDLVQPLLVAYSPQDHSVAARSSEELLELVGSSRVTRLVTDRSYHCTMLDYDGPRLEEAVVGFVGEVAEAAEVAEG